MLDGPTLNRILRTIVPRIILNPANGHPSYAAEKVLVRPLNDKTREGVRVSSLVGRFPVYASYDATSKSIILATNAEKVRWGKDMSRAFEGFELLKSFPNTRFDTSKVEDVTRVLAGCAYLPKLDLQGLDLRSVTRADEALLGCGTLTSVDLAQSSLQHVYSAAGAFANCYRLVDVTMPRFLSADVIDDSPRLFSNCKSLRLIDLSKTYTYGHFDPVNLAAACLTPNRIEIRGANVMSEESWTPHFTAPRPWEKEPYNPPLHHHNLAAIATQEGMVAESQHFEDFDR